MHIIKIPIKDIRIEIKVENFKISPNTIKPKIAAINGMVPNIKSVTATVVLVIEKIKPIKAIAKKIPPNKSIKLIVHLGAITSTTETDAKLIINNNINLSLFIWSWCVENKKRLIYASSAATLLDTVGSKGTSLLHCWELPCALSLLA